MNKAFRRRIVEMITKAGEGHIPSAFSIVDIIATLYEKVLKPDDYFILSKGHGCAARYVVLEQRGVLRGVDIEQYGTFDGTLGGHPDRTKASGVLCSTGSLGHGLPMAVGLALGLKIQGKTGRVFVLVGDGECHEGTTWESALVAKNLWLNLTVIVDNNHSAQQLIPHAEPFWQFKGFGWDAYEVNGHDQGQIACADVAREGPVVLVAHTTKGKGVSFLEGHGKWHHRIPNKEEYAAIMEELA
jgi:transketolase